MKYSFYKSKEEDGVTIYKFYYQNNSEFVKCFEFKSNIKAISNKPGMTRLFGKEIFDVAGNYFLFPLSYENVETGEFLILEESEKVFRIKFITEGNDLQGEWVLRRLSTGDTLFWKPFPVVPDQLTKVSSVGLENGDEISDVNQNFELFELEVNNSGEFKGILAAEGTWTGADFHTTMFSSEIIEDIAKKMKANIETQLVDYNHDFVSAGHFTKIVLKEERGIKYIWVEGVGSKPIPHGSGLSIILKSTIKWNSNLNVFVLLKANPLGGSIMTQNKPACTICMIR